MIVVPINPLFVLQKKHTIETVCATSFFSYCARITSSPSFLRRFSLTYNNEGLFVDVQVLLLLDAVAFDLESKRKTMQIFNQKSYMHNS